MPSSLSIPGVLEGTIHAARGTTPTAQARGRIAIASQPRSAGATRSTSLAAGREITDLLEAMGFSHARTQILELAPPVVCVLAVSVPVAAYVC
jgi:hypothetical protein